MSLAAPYGTTAGTVRFPAKRLEFTGAAAGAAFHASCAARERNRGASSAPRAPYRTSAPAARRWDRAASEVPYTKRTLRESYARTQGIYAANVAAGARRTPPRRRRDASSRAGREEPRRARPDHVSAARHPRGGRRGGGARRRTRRARRQRPGLPAASARAEADPRAAPKVPRRVEGCGVKTYQLTYLTS